MIILNTQTP